MVWWLSQDRSPEGVTYHWWNNIYMYTLKYIMERGEVEDGWATGHSQGYDRSAVPMEPSLKCKTWNYIDNSLGWFDWIRGCCREQDSLQCYWAQIISVGLVRIAHWMCICSNICLHLGLISSTLFLFGYYREYVSDFFPLPNPYISWLRKDGNLSRLQSVIHHLMSWRWDWYLYLFWFPDFSYMFVLHLKNASDVGLGAVLLQEHERKKHVVAYASCILSKAKWRYCSTKKELLAMHSSNICETFSSSPSWATFYCAKQPWLSAVTLQLFGN